MSDTNHPTTKELAPQELDIIDAFENILKVIITIIKKIKEKKPQAVPLSAYLSMILSIEGQRGEQGVQLWGNCITWYLRSAHLSGLNKAACFQS